MEKIIIACATNDGKNFIKDHFGSANKYLIYEFDKDKRNFILTNTVNNHHFEEKMDGDPQKAKFVASLIKPFGVNILMNMAIGLNVTRMRKKYVIIISRIQNINEALKKIDLLELNKEISQTNDNNKKIIYIS